MSDPRCETCRFFYFSAPEADVPSGVCRRYPPLWHSVTGLADYPGVRGSDWCGEYEEMRDAKS